LRGAARARQGGLRQRRQGLRGQEGKEALGRGQAPKESQRCQERVGDATRESEASAEEARAEERLLAEEEALCGQRQRQRSGKST